MQGLARVVQVGSLVHSLVKMIRAYRDAESKRDRGDFERNRGAWRNVQPLQNMPVAAAFRPSKQRTVDGITCTVVLPQISPVQAVTLAPLLVGYCSGTASRVFPT